MVLHINRKTNKKLGRKEQLERLQETDLEGDIRREIKKQILKDTKKPRKPPEKLRTELIKARVTEDELKKAQAYADKKGITVSQLIREYLRRLPALD
jgi:predicted HicB family RNase H-like nuclease